MVRRRAFVVLAVLASGAAGGCAPATVARSAPAAPAPGALARPVSAEAPAAADGGGLAFSVEPSDAEVLVDGRSYGKVAELARNGSLPLAPGLYQVSLRRAGFATWRAEVAVRSGVEPIRVTLSRRPAP